MAGYLGPCPPTGDIAHHYQFIVYALDIPSLGLASTTPPAVAAFTLSSHVLGYARITATTQQQGVRTAQRPSTRSPSGDSRSGGSQSGAWRPGTSLAVESLVLAGAGGQRVHVLLSGRGDGYLGRRLVGGAKPSDYQK